jgi:hypothetical protein
MSISSLLVLVYRLFSLAAVLREKMPISDGVDGPPSRSLISFPAAIFAQEGNQGEASVISECAAGAP